MLRILSLITGVLFIAAEVGAATRTWAGTTSGVWSVASNWGGTAPVAGDVSCLSERDAARQYADAE